MSMTHKFEIDPQMMEMYRANHKPQHSYLMGVQDFNPEVQKAVHRVQPTEQVFSLVEAARQRSFESVNVDLIYGLPQQTLVLKRYVPFAGT